MGWLIALGILALVALFPLGLSGIYDQNGPVLYLKIGPYKKKLYPSDKDETEDTEKSISTPQKAGAQQSEEKKGGLLSELLSNLETAKAFLGDVRRKIRVKRLEFRLVMAGDDPCDLAVNYGKAWAAVGNVMPLLESLFVIKKRNVEVLCDFMGSHTTVFVRLDITMSLARYLGLIIKYGLKVMKSMGNTTEIKKGGAVK